MVDEFEKDEAENEKVSILGIIFGFILTVILVPVLFVGTCVPVTMTASSIIHSGFITVAVMVGYILLFGALCIRTAMNTNNIGIKIAIWIFIVPIVLILFSALGGR